MNLAKECEDMVRAYQEEQKKSDGNIEELIVYYEGPNVRACGYTTVYV